MKVTENHAKYGTALQAEAVRAMLEHDQNTTKASEALGISRSTIRGRLDAVCKRATLAGYAPDYNLTEELPLGQHLKGASTMYRVQPDGSRVPLIQWVKSHKDQEDKAELMREALEGIAEPFRGAIAPTPAPEHAMSELLCTYPLGDPHIGLLAWHVETGADFDLGIAEDRLCRAMDQLVALAPPAERAVIMNLGDFFHSDNLQGTTARSGNALDVDSRWGKVYRIGLRILRRLIQAALAKHETVEVICAIGNHDDMTSQTLAMAMDLLFESEPRVIIHEASSSFHYVTHGKCLLGVTHGHTVKYAQLPGIMQVDQREAWGHAEFCHWYTGHVHHESVKDFPGVTVETFRTLAGSDAWHHSQGYRSRKDARVDVWHKDFGLINRHIVGIERLER